MKCYHTEDEYAEETESTEAPAAPSDNVMPIDGVAAPDLA